MIILTKAIKEKLIANHKDLSKEYLKSCNQFFKSLKEKQRKEKENENKKRNN